MIIFLYGPDDYRRLRKKQELVGEFRKKRSDFGIKVFDASRTGWQDEFAEFAANQPLFEPARLAVLENAFEEVEAAPLAKMLKPLLTDDRGLTVLLSERDKPVKALQFLIDKPARFQKFETLAGAEWEGFISVEAKRCGVDLAVPAARLLAAVYAGNSWGLATELEKLGSLGRASAADIAELGLETPLDYWALLTGLRSHDVRSRLAALERLFSTGDPPAKIFNILASQWKEKTAVMAEYDFIVKSGKLDYEDVLVGLAIS